jgi:ubiquinone/menaquinone biosynthesis C-methylase UbiE
MARTSKPQLRPDYKAIQRFYHDNRSEDRLIEHYLLERRLADRLRQASSADRAHVYTEVYNEAFESLRDHPRKTVSNDRRERYVGRLRALLNPYLDRDKVFLEIGCGDAILAISVAPHVACSYAVDVTDSLIDPATVPKNLKVVLTTSTEIPLPDASIDVAVSDQFMEHLHPDDAQNQLTEIFRVLKPGGIYHCITPNRVTGPHDVSQFFEYEATGFHLREYDSSMIEALFKQVGFCHIRFIMPIIGVPITRGILRSIEKTIILMPRRVRSWVSRRREVGLLVGLHVIGMK